MQQYIKQVTDMLNTDAIGEYTLIILLFLSVFDILMRIILCLGYQSQFTLYHINGKDITNKTDIKDMKFGLLNKVIKDYIKIGDRGIGNINTKTIVLKHVLRLNFIGWNYHSIEGFIQGFESSIVLVCIVLALVFPKLALVYGFMAVVIFVVIRLLGSIFDFSLVKTRLTEEITEYIDREIGQFYAGDISSVILRFKNEVSNALTGQSIAMAQAVTTLGESVSSSLESSMTTMNENVEKTLLSIKEYEKALQGPINDWKESILQAGKAQTEFNKELICVNELADKLNGFTVNWESLLQKYDTGINQHNTSVIEQMKELNSYTNELKEYNKDLLVHSESLDRQLQYIEKNQGMLDGSIQKYELILEELTRKMGDGFGNIVDFHMQKSFETLNDELRKNIGKTISVNNDAINQLKSLFNEMALQNKAEADAIIKIKEQMDYHFENRVDN